MHPQSLLLHLQVIPSDRHSSIRRTPDGTPWEVALTLGLKHPNIIACLAAGTFQNEVSSCELVAAAMRLGRCLAAQSSCFMHKGEPKRSGVCTMPGSCLAARTLLDELIPTAPVLCTACIVTLQAKGIGLAGTPLVARPGSHAHMRSGSQA